MCFLFCWLFVFAALASLTPPANAQGCTLPAACYSAPYSVPAGCPTSSVTAAQDQAALMCQQGLQFPTTASNPPLSSSRGNDPYAPTNAFPGTPTSASNINTANWTDALNHTIVRWGWGQWTTYDDSQGGGTPNVGCGNPVNGSSTCTKALELGSATGGSIAYNGVGDMGPAGSRPYPDTLSGTCSTPGCLSSTTYPQISLFSFKNGTKVTTPTDWWVKGRPLTASLVQKEIYGNPFPAYFNAWTQGIVSGSVVSNGVLPGPNGPAINKWTIGAVTTGASAGTIGNGTILGQPTNAPTYPGATGTPQTLPSVTCACIGSTGSCTVANNTASCTATYGAATLYSYRNKTYTATFNLPYNGFTPRNTPVLAFTCRFPANATGKVPVVISISESDTDASYTLPYGYGVCGYTQTSLQADGGGAATSSYLDGMYSGGNWRKPTDPGTLVTWAWGISRFIDFLAAGGDSDPNGPDPDKIAVEGHSRDGKATLVTMAYDNRLVAGLPSCGGEGGTSWIRRNLGESIESIVGSGEYYWMDGYLMNYAGPACSTNPNVGPVGCTPAYWPRGVTNLDVDVHSVMSLIAPRAVMTNGGTDTPAGNGDAWQDPTGMYLAGTMASPAWTLLGWTGQIIPAGTQFTQNPVTWVSTESTGGPNGGESIGGTPPFNVAFAGPNGPGGAGSATVAWHRHSAGHTDTPEWPVFAQWAAQYLWDKRPVIAAGQSFTLPAGAVSMSAQVQATQGGGGPLQNWQITGGTNNGLTNNGAYAFALNPSSGIVTVPSVAMLDPSATSYTLSVMVGDSLLPSTKEGVDATLTINIPTNLLYDGEVSVAKSGFAYNFTTKRYSEQVTITNLTQNAIPGPVALVFDSLSSNATVYGASGTTLNQAPAGSPYVNTIGLAANQSVTLTVQFSDPTMAAISYTPRVLAGSVSR